MSDAKELHRKKVLGMALYLMISEKMPDASLEKLQRFARLLGASGYEPSPKMLARAEAVLLEYEKGEP